MPVPNFKIVGMMHVKLPASNVDSFVFSPSEPEIYWTLY